MKKQIDVSLVLPCYNEEPIFDESVARIVASFRLSRLTFEIIFVDDKGQDRTIDHIKKACRRYPYCRFLTHTVNRGRGVAVADGFRMAKGVVVGYIDIDLEVSPVYIVDMVERILDNSTDVVIGRRIYRSSLGSLPREFFSVGYQRLSDWLVGTGGLDTETGYKFFRRTKILPLLSKATHPHWFWDTEIMVFAKRAGLRIAEVPVLFVRRFDKTSSVRIVRDIIDYLVNLWTFRKKLNDI